MATRALERGGLDRHLVARAEVLATDARGALLGTVAERQPWPAGPFPPPPDPSRGAAAGPGGRPPRVRVGGPDPSYFAVADSLGTGVSDDPADGRPVATETFGIGPGDAVYGFGETFLGLDKTGQTIDLWVADALGAHTPRCYKAVPFFLTTGGYGVFLHTSNRATAWVGSRAAHQVQVAVDDGVLDYFVLLGAPAEVLAGYTALTGRAPLPPPWSFGWWQSRCSYASAGEVLEVVAETRPASAAGWPTRASTSSPATGGRCTWSTGPTRMRSG